MWHFPIRNPTPAKSTFFGVNGEMKFTKWAKSAYAVCAGTKIVVILPFVADI